MPDAADTKQSASGAPAEKGLPEGDVRPLSSVRRVVARRMSEAWATIPAVTLHRSVPLAPLLRARERFIGEEGRHPALDALLAILVARTLGEFELLNGSYLVGQRAVLVHPRRNIGVAVDTPYGLTAVVLREADRHSPDEADSQLVEMVQRARTQRSRRADLAEATFTITNLGSLDVEAFTPIITPPQAAVLGVGAARPSPPNERPATLSLTFDHRVVDGAYAARFLARLAQRLTEDELWT
ncbi:MAG: 2-oxo acid dehydrogenase subunit E2 [Candidatus Limnocylindrales bacterium]|jgi:pyruvate dehydrogenase E2 component (dihydrolipoamide acetyltransferase)